MTIAINTPPQRIMPLSPDPTVYEVQGKRATEPEYFVALALEKLNIDYSFQKSFLGGKQLKGGFVIDFMVWTVPLGTPIWVHGEFWHKGAVRAKDTLQQAILDSLFRGKYMPAVILYGNDLQTEDQAYVTVKKALKI